MWETEWDRTGPPRTPPFPLLQMPRLLSVGSRPTASPDPSAFPSWSREQGCPWSPHSCHPGAFSPACLVWGPQESAVLGARCRSTGMKLCSPGPVCAPPVHWGSGR